MLKSGSNGRAVVKFREVLASPGFFVLSFLLMNAESVKAAAVYTG